MSGFSSTTAQAQCATVTFGANDYATGQQYAVNLGTLPWSRNGTSGSPVTTRFGGTLRIPAGTTITMEYAILEFDDTKARYSSGNTAGSYANSSNLPARILIEPGGKLDASHCIFRTTAGTNAGHLFYLHVGWHCGAGHARHADFHGKWPFEAHGLRDRRCPHRDSGGESSV